MTGSHIADDPVALVLLAALALLVGVPGVAMIVRKVTKPPFRAGSFRWLYLAWAMLLGATSVWSLERNVRFSAEQAGADNFVRLAMLLLGALAILFLGARYKFAFLPDLTSGALGIFSVFALWGLASTLWSVSPVGTLYKASEYFMMLVLFAIAASLVRVTFADPSKRLFALRAVFNWNWFLIFMLLVTVYVGVLVLPEYGIRRDVGVLGFSIQGAIPGISANGVGQLAAILGAVALARGLLETRSRMVYLPLLAVCVATLVLAQSRTPILAFLVATVVLLIATRRFGLLAALSFTLVATVLSAYGQTLYDFMRRNQNAENFETLSGRTTYWESSLRALQDNWINGFGANAGGRYVLQTALGETNVSSIHSTYVETLLDTGLVGLVLLLVGLGATWFWFFGVRSYLTRSPVGASLWLESLGVLTVLSIRSVFTITFVWTSAVLTFGLILVLITVTRRQIARQRRPGAPVAQPLPTAGRRGPSIRV